MEGNTLKPTPIWELPKNFNISEQEGREAFLAGKDIEANPFGESVAGQDWKRGWISEKTKAEAK